MSSMERCETCRYWQARRGPRVPGHLPGDCRRYAPTGAAGSFPHADGTSWCGEFEPREGIDQTGDQGTTTDLTEENGSGLRIVANDVADGRQDSKPDHRKAG